MLCSNNLENQLVGCRRKGSTTSREPGLHRGYTARGKCCYQLGFHNFTRGWGDSLVELCYLCLGTQPKGKDSAQPALTIFIRLQTNRWKIESPGHINPFWQATGRRMMGHQSECSCGTFQRRVIEVGGNSQQASGLTCLNICSSGCCGAKRQAKLSYSNCSSLSEDPESVFEVHN